MQFAKSKLTISLLTCLLFSGINAEEKLTLDWSVDYQSEFKGTTSHIASFITNDREQVTISETNQHYKSRNRELTIDIEWFDIDGNLTQRKTVDQLSGYKNFSELPISQNRSALSAVNSKDTVPVLVKFTDNYDVDKVTKFPNRKGLALSAVKEDTANGDLYLLWSSNSSQILEKITLSGDSWSYTPTNRVSSIALNSAGEVLLLSNRIDGTLISSDGKIEYNNSIINLTLLNSSGVEHWNREIDGSFSDIVYGAFAIQNSEWIVTGEADLQYEAKHSPISSLFINKIDVNGDVAWSKKYSNKYRSFGEELYVDRSNGEISIIGVTDYRNVPTRPGRVGKSWALKADINGDTTVTGVKESVFSKLKFENNGKISLRPKGSATTTVYDGNLEPIDTLAEASTKKFFGESNFINDGTLFAGKLFTVGQASSLGNGSKDILISISNTDGELLSQICYGDAGLQRGKAVVTSQNSLFVVGEWEEKLWLAQLNENGDRLWSRTYNDTVEVIGTAPANDGFVILCSSGSDETKERQLIRVDTHGEITWRNRVGSATGVTAYSVATYPGGYIVAQKDDYPVSEYSLRFVDESGAEVRKTLLQTITSKSMNTMNYRDGAVFLGGYGFVHKIDTVGNIEYERNVDTYVKYIYPLKSGEILFMGTRKSSGGPNQTYGSFGKLDRSGNVVGYLNTENSKKAVEIADGEYITVGDDSHITGWHYPPPGRPVALYSERYPITSKITIKEATSITKTALAGSVVVQRVVGQNLMVNLPVGINSGSVTLFSVSGRVVAKHNLNADKTQHIPMSHLSSGVYISKIKLDGSVQGSAIRFVL